MISAELGTTYEGEGEMSLDLEKETFTLQGAFRPSEEERAAYDQFLKTIQAEKL